jgi:hypothetical protein
VADSFRGRRQYHTAAGIRDALSVGSRQIDSPPTANGEHGLPRTNADKRRAVELLLADAEWSQWSDREIARRAAVNKFLVNQMRPSLSGIQCQIPAPAPRNVQRGDLNRARELPTCDIECVEPLQSFALVALHERLEQFR